MSSTNADDSSSDRDKCPTCGKKFTGIVTVGPSVHRLIPCNHRVGTMRTAEIREAEQ